MKKKINYSHRWNEARKVFMLKNPLCVFCQQQGIVTAATIVDHIVPHRHDQKLFWDRANWQALCVTHHQATKQRMEKGREIKPVGLDGWPLDG